MKYNNIHKAIFLERPNRFIAYCQIGEVVHKCHVKNTGRCKELLIKGATVYLAHSDNPNRSTQYSLIGVEKDGQIINIDSQAPNQVVYEALESGLLVPQGLQGELTQITRERTYGNSRFDFYIKTAKQEGFIEVKGVTLKVENTALFPDAPTLRGAKHIDELVKARSEGYYAGVLLVLQMTNCNVFTPNKATDPNFSDTLKNAFSNGVHVQAIDCKVTQDTLQLQQEIPILL